MNAHEPPRGFARTEFEARTERAQRLMSQADMKALLLMSEPEVRYFTGFLTQFWQSPTRPWFVLVPDAGKPIAVVPEIGGPVMRRTWIDDVRTWPSPRPADEGVSLLVDTLRGIGAAQARVGLLMGPETALRMPLADYQKLLNALPGMACTDATDLIRSLRMVKSEAEIAKIAHICGIASRAFAAVPDAVHAGQPLRETFRDFRMSLLSGGADAVPYLVGGAGPGGYSDVISPPSDRPLREGDVLMMDTGAVHEGYFCDFDRNYAIGRADDATRRAYETLYRATEDGLAAARPGATCAELFRAMKAVIAAAGYETGNVGRAGHGLGMQLTEWPSHAASDHTVLQAGMVLTLEPALTIEPVRSMVHEENIVIRPDGAELLSTRAPADVPVVT